MPEICKQYIQFPFIDATYCKYSRDLEYSILHLCSIDILCGT